MYGAFAVMLLALAGLSAGVLRDRRPDPGSSGTGGQLTSFLLVGAVALALWSVVVVVAGLFGNGSPLAESLAMLGFFTYALYLLAAVLVIGLSRRR